MEEKSIWRQKSGRASNNVYPLDTKKWAATARSAQRGSTANGGTTYEV